MDTTINSVLNVIGTLCGGLLCIVVIGIALVAIALAYIAGEMDDGLGQE